MLCGNSLGDDSHAVQISDDRQTFLRKLKISTGLWFEFYITRLSYQIIVQLFEIKQNQCWGEYGYGFSFIYSDEGIIRYYISRDSFLHRTFFKTLKVRRSKSCSVEEFPTSPPPPPPSPNLPLLHGQDRTERVDRNVNAKRF